MATLITAIALMCFVSIAHGATFSNTGSITIPDSGAATPYPSEITVSGVTGTVTKVTVTVFGISHTYPDDIDMLLVGPGGQTVMPMSDQEGDPDIEYFSGTTGQLVAWVKIMSIWDTDDTQIRMHCGNGSATSQQNAKAIWNFGGSNDSRSVLQQPGV